MSTATSHHHWDKPDVSGSANTWGSILNGTTDKIDQAVYDVEQGAPPVGAIIMFAGATAPPNWLLCNGAQIDTHVYAKLFAVIGNTFGGVGSAGNFILPNLGAQFPIGAGTNKQGRGAALGEVTGSFTVPIAAANLPAHAHPITDVAHTHTIDQTPHAHVDAGHVHPVSASQDAHNHTVPNAATFTAGGGLASGLGAVLGNQTTSPASASNVYVAIGTGYAQTQPINANVALKPSGTGLSTTQPNTGGGTPLDVIPPFVCLNFIIRFQ